MNVPFVTLAPMHREIQEELDNAYKRVVEKNHFIQGDESRKFEDEFSIYCQEENFVVLAKWLICDPKVLIADEPTRGIDVGAKREIYELMSKFASKGKGIIMISSELPELIGICDRIYIVSEGSIAGMLSRSEFSQESIMQFAVSNVQ